MSKDKIKKNGRPVKDIDFELIDNLCGIQCTGEEMASVLDIDYDTLNARIKEKTGKTFSEYFKQKSGKGKVSLRRKQFTLAQGGDKTMLIWLGKQYLNQSEKNEVQANIYNISSSFKTKEEDKNSGGH